ncbi:MAG: hypothetical protein QM820_17975 [Minicystis sp.]
MQIIPLLGEDDDTFAPPEVEVGTTGYGSVQLRNDSDRPTLVPPGAGWVVAQKAQDHAIGGGALLRPGESRLIDTAMCIQQSQGGLIGRAKHALLILPAALRAKALSVRHVQDFRKLWESIQELNRGLGIAQYGGHLEFFLRTFEKQLDAFVAEFEIVPRQVGAVILIGGEIVGIERAPSAAYWKAVWNPLIRVCYGSLAVKTAGDDKAPPATRAPLVLKALEASTLAGLREALARAQKEEQDAVIARLRAIRSTALSASSEADDTLGEISLNTVAAPRLAGQVATVRGAVRYASLCLAA